MSHRLLVVATDSDSRERLVRHLAARGFRVSAASGGCEALSLAESEAFDLVLLDVATPDIDGTEVLRRLRGKHALTSLPVIMMTNDDAGAHIEQALTLGANDYVTLPLDMSVLLARMRTHLELRRLARQSDELLRLASHELKDPLRHLSLLAGRFAAAAADEELRALLSEIAVETGRMQAVVEELLDFQTVTDGQFPLDDDELDLAVIAHEAVDAERERAAMKGISLHVERPLGVTTVRGDRRRLARVAHDLVESAVRHGEPGCRVVVSTGGGDGRATLDVSGTGPGGPPEAGSALGLAIARRCVEAHGGRMATRHDLAGGATFTIELPTPTLRRIPS